MALAEELDSLLHELFILNTEIEKNQRINEKICYDVATLFKPWPRKSNETKEVGNSQKNERGSGVENSREALVIDKALAEARQIRSRSLEVNEERSNTDINNLNHSSRYNQHENRNKNSSECKTSSSLKTTKSEVMTVNQHKSKLKKQLSSQSMSKSMEKYTKNEVPSLARYNKAPNIKKTKIDQKNKKQKKGSISTIMEQSKQKTPSPNSFIVLPPINNIEESLPLDGDCGENLSNEQLTHGKCTQTENTHLANGFLLSQDGANLKIPSRVKRIFTTNHKLKHKVMNVGYLDKKDNEPRRFLKRIEKELLLGCSELDWLFNIITQLSACYKELLWIVESTRTKSMSGKLSPKSYFTLKAQTEKVIDLFNVLEKKYYPIIAAAETLSLSNGVQASIHIYEPSYPKDWSTTHSFRYPGKKFLNHMVILQNEESLLKWQLSTTNKIADKLIPKLQQLDPSASEHKELHQTLHTLLLGQGVHFPVVVQDVS